MTLKEHQHSFNMFDGILEGDNLVSTERAEKLGLPLVDKGVKWGITAKCVEKDCDAAEAWPNYGESTISDGERYESYRFLSKGKLPQKQIVDLGKK